MHLSVAVASSLLRAASPLQPPAPERGVRRRRARAPVAPRSVLDAVPGAERHERKRCPVAALRNVLRLSPPSRADAAPAAQQRRVGVGRPGRRCRRPRPCHVGEAACAASTPLRSLPGLGRDAVRRLRCQRAHRRRHVRRRPHSVPRGRLGRRRYFLIIIVIVSGAIAARFRGRAAPRGAAAARAQRAAALRRVRRRRRHALRPLRRHRHRQPLAFPALGPRLGPARRVVTQPAHRSVISRFRLYSTS